MKDKDKFFIFDDVLNEDQHNLLFNGLKNQTWTTNWSSLTDKSLADPVWHFNKSYINTRVGLPAITDEQYDEMKASYPFVIPLWEETSSLIKNHLGKFNILRLYANLNPYGTNAYIHEDDGDYTMLYYASKKWNPMWEGGTCFYKYIDDDKNQPDAIRYISYKPNRLVIFPAKIPHRGMPVDRRCYVERYIVAMKLQQDVNDADYVKKFYSDTK